MSVRGLVATLTAVVLLSGTTSAVRADVPPPATAVTPGEVHSAADGVAKATAMLTLVALPPGATNLVVSPTPDLAGAQSTASDNFIDVPAFYSVPVTKAAFATYLTTLTIAGFSHGLGSFGGNTTMDGFVSDTVGWDALILIYYQDVGGHVDVRVDGQVIWLPNKTAAEMIPLTLPRASLAYTGPTSSFGRTGDTTPKPKHAHVVLTAGKLRKLITALNALSTVAPGESSCPAGFGEMATITMSFGGHKIVARVFLDGCQGVALTSDGQDQPGLTSSQALTNAIYAAVGIRRTPIPPVKPQGPPVRTLAKPFALQHNKVQAQRVGDRALDYGGLLPDDVRYSNSLKNPTKPPYFGKGTLVDRASFWTIEGKVGDLVNWVRAHPGTGNVAAEPYTTKHGIRRLDIEPKDRSKPTTANVWISMVQKGPLVVFRIDAQTAYS
ncbi:hypothetical protein acdb102_19290 [Acidothermaceae bacterium B102]|nr:hypothetical protein acdb102_19290 [Acidothermaceae bacterium B102]